MPVESWRAYRTEKISFLSVAVKADPFDFSSSANDSHAKGEPVTLRIQGRHDVSAIPKHPSGLRGHGGHRLGRSSPAAKRIGYRKVESMDWEEKIQHSCGRRIDALDREILAVCST
jgi:hypothetical protein